MKKKIFAILFLAFSLTAKPENQPTTLLLNGNWQFALAKTEVESTAYSGFFLSGFEAKGFNPIPVPSNWAVLGYEEPVYRGFKGDKASEGYYLHEFAAPKDWLNKRVLLHFGGVWSHAEIWLNGVYLGRHDGGYTSFSMDVTGKLKESNKIAVKVQQVSKSYKFDVYDDWTLGGIYRDVMLEAMPRERWIDNVTAQSTFDNQFTEADLKVRVMISDMHKTKLPGNYPLPGEPYDVRITLTDTKGNQVAQNQLTIPGHSSTDREIPFCLRIKNPEKWSAETPYLYQLTVELLENNKVAHVSNQHIGFRQISTSGGVFRINGQAVKLRGVNRHDEHPDVGRATTRTHWLQDLKLMKAANINYIRLSHYTPAEGFIELCDSMGMYVGNEVSIGGAADLMYDPSMSGATLQRTYETVKRDINSPSIIYWSVGNEDPLTSLHLAAVKLLKAIDPTRPVLLPWRTEAWLPEEIDILAPHYWKPQEYDRLAGNSTRPIISTEYTHAYGNDGMGGLEACWKALTKYPAGAGAAVWMWADQGIKTPVEKQKKDLAENNNYMRLVPDGWDGIVDAYRNPTRDYWEVKAVYAPVYPAVDKVEFIPGQSLVNIPIQNDYDFTNLEKITIKWLIREDESDIDSGTVKLQAQPHSLATLKLPVNVLKKIDKNKTYYVWLSFFDEKGSEIIKKSVELIPDIQYPAVNQSNFKLKLTKGELSKIECGDVSYMFNPKTGQLSSASKGDKVLITSINPIVWQKLDKCESTIPGNKQVRDAEILSKFKPEVVLWNIKESNGFVTIDAKVKYLVDEKNQFSTTYHYSIDANGDLTVHYELLTNVTAPWLPVVGMTITSPADLTNIKWLGLGMFDAYPNKKAASIFGVWSGAINNPDVCGIKLGRWVEKYDEKYGFRVAGNIYIENDVEKPETMNILSYVLGRPEKGRKADESIPQLITNTNEPFVGEFKIQLK